MRCKRPRARARATPRHNAPMHGRLMLPGAKRRGQPPLHLRLLLLLAHSVVHREDCGVRRRRVVDDAALKDAHLLVRRTRRHAVPVEIVRHVVHERLVLRIDA